MPSGIEFISGTEYLVAKFDAHNLVMMNVAIEELGEAIKVRVVGRVFTASTSDPLFAPTN